MAIPEYRFFFDTSVYISGLISPKGAARELLRLIEVGAIRMVISQEVIVETDRVLSGKFPGLIEESRILWKHLAPEMVPDPAAIQIKPFLKELDEGDAKILCAAQSANVVAFVTWNTKDFMSSAVKKLVEFPIVIPADGLLLFRKWIDPFLR